MPEEAAGQPAAPLTALVIHGDPETRHRLIGMLENWNVRTTGVGEAEDALAECRTNHHDFVLCAAQDDTFQAPSLCREIRRSQRGAGAFISLLTDDPDKEELAACIDDVLPMHPNARDVKLGLRSGLRTLRLREELLDTGEEYRGTRDLLDAAQSRMDQALAAAARLQQPLLPERQNQFGPFRVGTIHRAADQVTGDMIGCHLIGTNKLAFHALDLSGRGVPTAVTMAMVSELLAQRDGPDGLCDPAQTAEALNQWFWDDTENDQFMTCVLADLDAETGMLRFCQAGHPAPLIIRMTGQVDRLDSSDTPIGVGPDPFYRSRTAILSPGESVLLISDGILKAVDCGHWQDPEAALIDLLADCQADHESEVLQRLWRNVLRSGGCAAVADDVSALLVRMPGRPRLRTVTPRRT